MEKLTVDAEGRIVIPPKVAHKYGLRPGEEVSLVETVQLFIKGNLDPVNVRLLSTPEQVSEKARRCVDVASPGGGYILNSACSIPLQTPPANILKLHQPAKEFGR